MLNSNSLDATPLFPYTGQDPLANIYDRDTAQCLQKLVKPPGVCLDVDVCL